MAVEALGWVWSVGVALALVAFCAAYTRGWLRMRRVLPGLATRGRLVAALAGALLIAAALAGPLAVWSQQHYFARMGQKVAICLAGAPLVWLGAPFHMVAWSAPRAARGRLAAWFVRPHRFTGVLQGITSPAVVWFAYLSAFLLWHDPGLTAWSMASGARQRGLLAVLTIASLLFWQQITHLGPRQISRAGLLARVAMLAAVEVANVVAGITIAFHTTPLYSYYAQLAGPGLSEQTLGGALTWIFGSVVYITSIVLVVNQIFKREGSDRPQPLAGWDAEEKFIAPGLEERLYEVGWERHDWRK